MVKEKIKAKSCRKYIVLLDIESIDSRLKSVSYAAKLLYVRIIFC